MDDKEEIRSSFSRRNFIRNSGLTAASLIITPRLISKDLQQTDIPSKQPVKDKLYESGHAVMQGFLGKKLDQSYKNGLLTQNVDNLIEPFRHRNETSLWQSEFWGKWFTSAIAAYRYRPEPELKKVIDSAVTGLIATQTSDGYIGNYRKENRLEQWDIWGMKYCMLGLLQYYELTNDEISLKATRKLADYVINTIEELDGKIINKGNYRGMAASSILEPMVGLYRLTNKKRYLDFAKEIVTQWETPDGPQLISKANIDVSRRFPRPDVWYSWSQGQKAYEMMSCYEGLIELYRITGEDRYKEAVEKTWENINNTEINIAGSGASVEMWFGGKELQTSPIKHYQETCVTVTWIKLSQQLLRLTGESKYADAIEKSYYNALMGALNEDGSIWAKYTPLNGERLPGSGQCGMELNCCNANGPRGQFTLPLTAVMGMENGLSVNFFVEGSYSLKTPTGQSIKVIQKTDYPISGKITFALDLSTSEKMTIRIRIPSWSDKSILKLNNELIKDIISGQYAEINKNWTSKDIISLELDMRGRVGMLGNYHRFAAVTRGPIVLSRDSGISDLPLGVVIAPITTSDGYIDIRPGTMNKAGYWMQYYVPFQPESYKETPADPIQVPLCDYASAGNAGDRSTFKVWLPQLYNPEKHS